MTRTGQAAIDYARGRVGPNAMPASGYCLAFVRECFAVASYYGSAIDAWNGSNAKHPGDRNPPPAVPLYFKTPSQYDHVVFGGSAGEIITTFNADVRRYTASTSSAAIDAICRDFDGTYLGWTEDINRVTVWAPEPEEDDVTPDEVYTASANAIKDVLRAPEFQGYMRDLPWSHPMTAQVGGEGGWVAGPTPVQGFVADIYSTTVVTGGQVDAISDGVDELKASGVRAWPSTIALILAVAIVAGLVAAIVGKGVHDGVWTGSAALVGGLIGWAVTTLGRRVRGTTTAGPRRPTNAR